MKRSFIFLFCICTFQIMQGQYYYQPHINTGQNPGNVNNENENLYGFGLHPAWISIHNGSAPSAVWTSIQALPFNFIFDGVSVSSYMVSTSGIVSFDTLTILAAPSYQNSTLPSSLIPDRSICVWGIEGSGTNDKIVTRTVGTSPYRQHWISFNSYTSHSNGCYVFWSVVMEETTNKIFIVDQRNGGCQQQLTLGLQYDAISALSINGSPAINGTTGSGVFISDNTYYEFISGTQPQWQAALQKFELTNSAIIPTNEFTQWKIYNAGSATIDSLNISYHIDGATFTDKKKNLAILPGTFQILPHNVPVTIYDAKVNDITCWISLAGDNYAADDTLHDTLLTFSHVAPKRMVIEEFTGTWCGYCPKGIVAMHNLGMQYPTTAFPIAVHNGDPMVVSGYDSAFLPLITNVPSGMVDRNELDIDPPDFITLHNKHLADTPYCEVWMNTQYNSTTREIIMDVQTKFAISLDGDYRFNVAITEDEVHGLTPAYAQMNFYSFMSQNQPLVGAGHNWQLDSNPVPAWQMYYHNVARALLGGFDGQPQSIPVSVKADSLYSYTFVYTIPSAYNESKIKMIAWVQEDATGKILNAISSSIASSVQNIADNKLSIFPNPANDLVYVQGENLLSIKIFNEKGQLIFLQEGLNNNLQTQIINLSNQPNGVYTIIASTANEWKRGRAVLIH